MNATGEQFGISRLERSIDSSRSRPIRESVQSILTHVERWQGTMSFGDDLSVLAVERHLVPVVEPAVDPAQAVMLNPTTSVRDRTVPQGRSSSTSTGIR